MIVAAVRRMRAHPRPWIWTGAAIALGLVVGLVPLFGVLGYELALGASLFAAVAGLDLGAALARSVQLAPPAHGLERATYAGRVLARSTLAAAALAVAVALVPAVICAVRGLWVPTCDWWFGIRAYALMPVITAALAGALGHLIAATAGVRARRRRLPHRATVLALAVPLVGLSAAALYRFYSEPPVFVYSPILGYFPGNMYDENVQLGAPLLWSRLEQLAWIVALAAAVASRLDVPTFRVRLVAPRPAGRRVGAIALAIAAAAAAILLRMNGGALGFAVDAADIQDVLSGRVETAHFIIHYAHTPAIDADIKLIAEDHELRLAEVVAQLGVAPAHKLESYYFANGDQKARWMGARNVEMAKPWRGEIYLDHRGFPQSSLRHEIAHAVAAEFGDPIFGVAVRHGVFFNPGLIEGLAVAIDWPGDGTLTPHESVRALQELGFQPQLGDLFSYGFLAQSSLRGYTTAGSFVRFLFDRYGAARLRALYASGGDFSSVYGKPLSALEREWAELIAAIALPADVIQATRERFRQGSVFSRPCPHAIAARREQASAAAGAGEQARAISIMREVCTNAPEEPDHRYELALYLARGNDRDRAEALELWTRIADDAEHVTSTLRARALEQLAQRSGERGDLAHTRELLARAAALPLDGDLRRQITAELYALDHEGAAGPALRGYFFAPPYGFRPPAFAELAIIGEPDDGFGHYLLALQSYNAEAWASADAEMQKALAAGVPNVDFVERGARALAIAAYRTGDTAGVTAAIAALRGPGTSEVDHLLADDWQHRLAFDASGHL